MQRVKRRFDYNVCLFHVRVCVQSDLAALCDSVLWSDFKSEPVQTFSSEMLFLFLGMSEMDVNLNKWGNPTVVLKTKTHTNTHAALMWRTCRPTTSVGTANFPKQNDRVSFEWVTSTHDTSLINLLICLICIIILHIPVCVSSWVPACLLHCLLPCRSACHCLPVTSQLCAAQFQSLRRIQMTDVAFALADLRGQYQRTAHIL